MDTALQDLLNQINASLDPYIYDILFQRMTITDVKNATGLSVYYIVSYFEALSIDLSDYDIQLSPSELIEYNQSMNEIDSFEEKNNDFLYEVKVDQLLPYYYHYGYSKQDFYQPEIRDFFENVDVVETFSYDNSIIDGDEYTVFLNTKLGVDNVGSLEAKIGFVNKLYTDSFVDKVELEIKVQLDDYSYSQKAELIWDQDNQEIVLKDAGGNIKGAINVVGNEGGKFDVSIGFDQDGNLKFDNQLSGEVLVKTIPMTFSYEKNDEGAIIGGIGFKHPALDKLGITVEVGTGFEFKEGKGTLKSTTTLTKFREREKSDN